MKKLFHFNLLMSLVSFCMIILLIIASIHVKEWTKFGIELYSLAFFCNFVGMIINSINAKRIHTQLKNQIGT